MLKSLGGILLTVATVSGCTGVIDDTTSATSADSTEKAKGHLPNNFPIPNASGFSATFSTKGYLDLNDDFFQAFGTNGRTCGTCHTPTDGWTVTPASVQARFEATAGLDPIFRTNDGSVSGTADVSTKDKRRKAYAMLLSKAVIRVGIGIPTGADFEMASIDDPYHFATADNLSLFRRPLPSANLQFLSTVMWDGRETQVDTGNPPASDSNCLKPPFAPKCFKSIDIDLLQQALDATLGHAQAMVPGLTDSQKRNIVDFEEALYAAQTRDWVAGRLDKGGATGGAENIGNDPTYFGINDNFGDYQTGAPFTSKIFSTYDAWSNPTNNPFDGDGDWDDAIAAKRAQIARGQAIFNNKQFTISGVGGLNGNLGLPASFTGTCGTCHDSPEAGDHSVVAPLNIGISDASRRTPDMPLYTLRCSAQGVADGHCAAGQTVQTTDPGRALISGQWADIGKFKGPVLRNLAARAPYFHNGSAADLGAAVDFYDSRFNIGFTAQERADLVAFLAAL